MSKKTLSDSMIKATKPSSKDLRLFDGNGLYLLIKPNNSRGWRIDYTINKKRKTLSLGTYPLITLAEARNSAFDVKKMVSNGIDPSDIRKSQKIDEDIKQKNHDRISQGLSDSYDKMKSALTELQTEKQDLEDQVKDLMKHIEILDLMGKAGNNPDIVEGKLLIRQSNSKKKFK